MIAVADIGPGISDDVADRLFQAIRFQIKNVGMDWGCRFRVPLSKRTGVNW